jgi:hypothetical protein
MSRRLFVSVDLPDELADEVAAIQDEFRDASGLRFTDPAQAHVTVKFLGDVESGRVEAVETALASAVADADVDHATAMIPRPCASLAQVLLLPPTRQRVLRSLLDIPECDRSSVENTTTAIVADDSVDLSAGTLKRYLYELADDGIVERIRTDGSTSGRPPSRIEPRFPTQLFCQFYHVL